MLRSLVHRTAVVIPLFHFGSNTADCNGQRSVLAADYKVKVKAGQRTDTKKNILEKDFSNFLIVSGTANKQLSKDICDIIGTTNTPTNVWLFSDGELSCSINETVRGKDVYYIQSFGAPVNDNLMELFLTVAALKRSGANKVTTIIPYFGYKFHRNRGLPITTPYGSRFMWNSSADIAKMLNVVGADKVISIDLQRPGQNHEACFFDNNLPVETVDSTSLFVDYFVNTIYNPKNCNHLHVQNKVVVLSSNTEFVKKARRFRRKLEKKATIGKVGYAAFLDDDVNIDVNAKRSSSKQTERIGGSDYLLGNVNGCDVIIVDDIVESGLGISQLCKQLKRSGAKKIYIAATHGLYTSNAMQLIDLSSVDKLITTDSIPLPKNGLVSNKIIQLSVAPLLARVVETELYNTTGTGSITINSNSNNNSNNNNSNGDVSGGDITKSDSDSDNDDDDFITNDEDDDEDE